MQKPFLIAIVVFLSGCSLSIPQNIQTATSQIETVGSQTLSTITERTKDFKNKIVTMIGSAEVTALPMIENIKEQVQTNIISLIQGTSTSNSIVDCLKEKGVVYYTSNSCVFAQQQKAYLEDEYNSFDRIYCDEGLDLVLCRQLGISGTPARGDKNGTIIYGVQTVASLATSFGCN